jgi:putative membrane protein
MYRKLVRWTAAWPFAVMNQLRGRRGLGPLADELPDDEVQAVLSAQHPPLAITVRISALLLEARRRGHLSDFVQMTLDQNVQQLVDYMGACERIRNTPLPFAYVVHLRRALVIYCFSLPFALVDTFAWFTVLAVFLVTYIFFGVEEIGVQIEDPFGVDDNDLPLDTLCENIRKNVLGVGDANAPPSTSLEPPPRRLPPEPNART